MKKALNVLKVVTLLTAMHMFRLVPWVMKQSKKSASELLFRREPLKFPWLQWLEWTSFLFLTDPHIGGNIDAIAHDVSEGIQAMLTEATRENTIILHGGDFVSSNGPKKVLSFENFQNVAKKLFAWLEGFRHFAVIGNHDEENESFPECQKWLQDDMHVHFLTESRDAKKLFIGDKNICIHGLHTLADHLHRMKKKERDMILDEYIYALNHMHNDLNIVLLRDPDGLEFLLKRLVATNQSITAPTLFLAGHTHGAMFDVDYLRHLGLRASKTHFGRYKGWYWPEWQFARTGNWKMYVSTGMGNSPGFDMRINADPEVVLFTL